MTPDEGPDGASRLTLSALRQRSSIGALRGAVTAAVEERVAAGDRRYDVMLAASELMANAVEHGAGDEVVVRIDVSPERLTISVETDASTPLPERATWGTADPMRSTGRGLGIVAFVSDGVDVRTVSGRTRVTTWFLLDDPGPQRRGPRGSS
jgi:anti-sigma regulatory factor (Ser/Thr protein kinase)